MKPILKLLFSLFLLLFDSCHEKTDSDKLVNSDASIPASFQFDKIGLYVINSSINKKKGTMSTLYGNKSAVKRLRENPDSISADEQLTFITWKQKEDEHWFGAKIPDQLLSAETIKTRVLPSGQLITKYEKYEGKQLILNSDTLNNTLRKAYILSQRSSVMP